METVLEVHGLTIDFGGLRALDRINLDIRRGEIHALIGPNGAGKTTFFNCITGIYTPGAGDIFIFYPKSGEKIRINGQKPNRVTEKGLARTFQNIRLFSGMTVLENVLIGRHCRTASGIAGAFLRGKKTKNEEKDSVSRSMKLLEKVGLDHLAGETAGNLAYGLQRRLEIARAMATEPFLLLLDEPAAGMNPQETRDLDALIRRIRDEDNMTILLIEHDMLLVMSLSDRISVMDCGKMIACGGPAEIAANPVVISAYLGGDMDA